MKKVSLKIKLTLLYTIFILVVVGTVLGILFSLSGREILAVYENVTGKKSRGESGRN